jgi:protein ImuA
MPTQPLSTLLPPRRRDAAAPLALPGGLALVRGRVHEVCGPSRRTFALVAARGLGDAGAGNAGPIIWIRPAWMAERLNPDGVRPVFDPRHIVFVTPTRPEDLLWSAEEALRSGAAPLVVADLTEAPALTPVRRLHLAAEAGSAAGRIAPVGLILTPGDGGAQGAETRWHIAPAHGARPHGTPPHGNPPHGAPHGSPETRHRAETPVTAWALSLRRARALPPSSWVLAATPGPDAGLAFTLARSGTDQGMTTADCPVIPTEG